VKRILLSLLTLTVLVFGLSANGQGDESGATKEKKLEIAVVYMNITAPFAGFIKAGVDAAADELGVNAYMTGATDWETGSQIQVIENLITKKVDGISTAVLDIPGLTPIIQTSMDAGVPITTFNVDAPESARLGFCGADLVAAGWATAEALVDVMGTEGKIILTSVAAGAVWSQQREEGVREYLKKYPGIEIVDYVNASGDEQTAYAALENSYLANQDVDGMISMGGTQYLWCRMMENRNIGNMTSESPIYNVGHDLYEEKLNQIKNGWATAAFGQDPYKQGYQAVKMLVDYINEKVHPIVMDTGVFEVNVDNCQKYLDDLAAGKPVG
jgi:ribose transport system substrate-binding protein